MASRDRRPNPCGRRIEEIHGRRRGHIIIGFPGASIIAPCAPTALTACRANSSCASASRCARTVNAAGTAVACWRLRRLYAYLAVLGRCSEHAWWRIGSRACAVAVDNDKTTESMHFVYEIPYSGICGLVGTHATIFDE